MYHEVDDDEGEELPPFLLAWTIGNLPLKWK